MSIADILRYVWITLNVTSILFIPIIVVRRCLTQGKLKNDSWKHEITSLIFIFYILALYQITALRLGGIGWNLENMIERRTRVNQAPLALLWRWTVNGVWWYLFYNVIGNCVWFIPMGVILPAIYKQFRGKPFWVIFIGMSISSSIEVLQYILCTGVTDLDDVIFNTVGTGIGYLGWYSFDYIRKRIKLKRERNIKENDEFDK